MSQEALHSADSSPDPPESSQLLDRYEILDRLGEGGFGVVYKARQRTTGQLVAIKQIRGSETVQSSVHEEMRRRFKREMSLIGNLRNAHVVRLLDAGASGDDLFMVLEFVDGVALSKHLISHGALPLDHALRIIEQVLEALAEAHDLGIVHRDLKPDNIMISGSGSRLDAKVLDFGIAGVEQDFRGALEVGHETITKFGQFLGTPSYMAPEQFQLFDDPRVQTDIYAIGLILLECLTGERAVTGANLMEIAQKQARDATPIPADVAPSVASIIDRATRKSPEDRFPSADEMLRVVSALRSGTAEAEVLAMTAGGRHEADPAPTVAVGPGAANATRPAVDEQPATNRELPDPADSVPGQAADVDLASADFDTLDSVLRRRRLAVIGFSLLAVASVVALVLLWPPSTPETARQATTTAEAASVADSPLPEPVVAPAEPGLESTAMQLMSVPMLVAAANGSATAAVGGVATSAVPDDGERIKAALLNAFMARQRNQLDEASRHYDEVFAVEPTHPDALEGKAHILLEQGLFEQALPLLESLGEHADRAGRALYLRARAHVGLDDPAGAQALFLEYVERHPDGQFVEEAHGEVQRIDKERRRRDRRDRGDDRAPDVIQGGPLIEF